MFEESTRLCDIKYKIVMLGNSSVGKSAMIERFVQSTFDPNKSVLMEIYSKQSALTF
jgi:GTPase SAR1 family protein